MWGPALMQRVYYKYGIEPPAELNAAVSRVAGGVEADPGQGTVVAYPIDADVEFLINATVGNHVLSLDLDTGSSDLWVFSMLQSSVQRTNRHDVYDPVGSNAKLLEQHSWRIRYGDDSQATGVVYLDTVTIGGLSVKNQAVGAARDVTASFTKDKHNDGLLGLGFSKLNSIKPVPQKTWFDNVKPQLAAPLFTCTLKRGAEGSYDFGYIDQKKIKGEVIWQNVAGTRGFWDVAPSGFSFANGPVNNNKYPGIIDTGTSLWIMPKEFVDRYWSQVKGATYLDAIHAYIFPCGPGIANPPDITTWFGNRKVTIPGINMNYQKLKFSGDPTKRKNNPFQRQAGPDGLMCYGGLQNLPNMKINIYGDIFLKGVMAIFEAAPGKQARLGLAEQS
ncbi:aspartyl protease [Trichodelitschia bisporula]|uniref:Aspartyl protease n=1 Tax=Trichodelitschia bisporula TaxID=703511 RepID=A0A6G1HJ03_9PEZI|nr:aspartyl protease [Trichodelitschia bisporula]